MLKKYQSAPIHVRMCNVLHHHLLEGTASPHGVKPEGFNLQQTKTRNLGQNNWSSSRDSNSVTPEWESVRSSRQRRLVRMRSLQKYS